MLVLRVAEEVRRDEDLCEKWYPLPFAEESYPVTTPGEFWLEALFHLAHRTDDRDLKKSYDEIGEEKDENRLRERALARLLDVADEQDKGVLLIVENLNMLLGDQISPADAWVLRETLLHEPRVMLLATATSQLRWEKRGILQDEIANLEKAMFELFKLYELKPLNLAECSLLLRSITGKDSSEARIRPIEILTGGNPRLLTIVAGFVARMSL